MGLHISLLSDVHYTLYTILCYLWNILYFVNKYIIIIIFIIIIINSRLNRISVINIYNKNVLMIEIVTN